MQLPEWEGEFRGVSLHLLIKKIQGQYIRITSQNTTQNLCQKNTPNKTSSFLPNSLFFFFFWYISFHEMDDLRSLSCSLCLLKLGEVALELGPLVWLHIGITKGN